MIKKENNLFWILQLSGWFLLWVFYLALYYRDRLDDPNAMIGLGITYLTGFLVTIPLRKFYQLINYQSRTFIFLAAVIIFCSIFFANIWYWFDSLLTQVFIDPSNRKNMTLSWYLSYIWSDAFVIILWSSLYFSIKLWFDWGSQLRRAEKADALAQSAQLQMLRYQLNPHFLFNSLNSIRALIEEDRSRAKSMITELSEFLRYSLISKNFSDVPLRQELDAVRHYLAIEKTRYEEKLEIKFDISEEAEEYPVLSFLIHPIIENAIKYGMKTTDLPLRIKISAKVVLRKLILEICNSGKWIEGRSDQKESTGTGLKNVAERLESAFPGKHSFSVDSSADMVCVRIEIEGKNE